MGNTTTRSDELRKKCIKDLKYYGQVNDVERIVNILDKYRKETGYTGTIIAEQLIDEKIKIRVDLMVHSLITKHDSVTKILFIASGQPNIIDQRIQLTFVQLMVSGNRCTDILYNYCFKYMILDRNKVIMPMVEGLVIRRQFYRNQTDLVDVMDYDKLIPLFENHARKCVELIHAFVEVKGIAHLVYDYCQ